mgnify:CR=1 FL=1
MILLFFLGHEILPPFPTGLHYVHAHRRVRRIVRIAHVVRSRSYWLRGPI